MTAVVPTRVEEFSGLNLTLNYGSSVREWRIVVVDVTTSANTDTTNLATYVDGCTGIGCIMGQAIAAATAATSATWSSTTITWAGHTGSGVTNAAILVY